MPGHLRKRSFALAGHRTSVALEADFWSTLETLARRQKLSLTALIARVDAGRTEDGLPLASALRVFALRQALDQVETQDAPNGQSGDHAANPHGGR
jgi:predicted DNA-binding ribbon-helix-helix protein